LWALLKANCDFNILEKLTDERMIWIETYSKGFSYFENADEYNYSGDELKKMKHTRMHYLPHP